jgi:LysM repeat protein
MAEVAEKMEELTVPEGGIADFVMDDDELEEAYGEKASDFGDDGIAQFPALAERMAKYGRNEDNMLAHVAEGELVIPAQFLQDEVMKQRIYDILAEAGVEDPEAYVVGSEANDINPTTGLPEFFLKKLFKGIGKAIKKVVKAVVKVVKKIAPIVLPIALAFTPLGPIYGAALGSGIGTLINGGSIKDALKSALISGAIGGVTAGFTGGGSFGENVSAAFADPGARLAQTASGFQSTVTGGGFTGEGNLFSSYVPTPGAEVDAVVQTADPNAPAAQSTSTAGTQQIQSGDTLSQIAADNNTTVQALMDANPNITDPNVIQAGDTINLPQAGGGTTPLPGAERNLLEKTGDYMFRGGKSPTEIAQAVSTAETSAIKQTLAKYGHTGPVNTAAPAVAEAAIAAGNAAKAAAAPGMLAKFGPSLAAGTLAMGATGMFEVPEPEQASFIDYNPDGTPVTGQDLIDADPSRYLIADLGRKRLNPETGEYEDVEVDLTVPAPDTSPYTVPTQYPVTPPPGGYGVNNSAGYLLASNPGGPFARPYVTAAQGGAIPEVFPRRNGGIMPNEGTPGEDSVRAMLMPGEFVMTTDAVRGMGNGNLNNGIKNMYSVMRNLESRGRAMA